MAFSPPCTRNSADGDFFFYVDGLPTYYTWGMLKDLARRAAPYPGWTEMAANTHGMQRGRGWIKVKRPKDALNLYGFFTSGAPLTRPLKVALWSTAKSPPELLRSNGEFPRQMQTFLQQTADIPQSNNSAGTLLQSSRHVVQHQRTSGPTYVYSQDRTPINATSGLVKIESRGIFISHLDFTVDRRQLEEYLSRIGDFESCDIRRDTATGKSRGIATARYKTAEAAATAVQMFHGHRLAGKHLNVRFDTESKAVTNVIAVKYDGPIIANGSIVND